MAVIARAARGRSSKAGRYFELPSADRELTVADGAVVASDSSADLVNRQAEGRWLYVINHVVVAQHPHILHSGEAK